LLSLSDPTAARSNRRQKRRELQRSSINAYLRVVLKARNSGLVSYVTKSYPDSRRLRDQKTPTT
jgi:hypothetical protein